MLRIVSEAKPRTGVFLFGAGQDQLERLIEPSRRAQDLAAATGDAQAIDLLPIGIFVRREVDGGFRAAQCEYFCGDAQTKAAIAGNGEDARQRH